MKIIDLLREEFKDYVKSKYKATKKRSHPVFVNPSSKEVLEAASNEDKFVRFIIDLTNKNFYVFNAIGLVHGDVLESLKLQHTRNILDMGVYKKGKIFSGWWDEREAKKYPWLKRYFTK